MDSLSAIRAYQQQMARMQDVTRGDADEVLQTSDSPFAQMLESTMASTVGELKSVESLQMQAVTGKAELTDLVTAVASAELSLNTVVAVRDRVINAYNDIIRMAI